MLIMAKHALYEVDLISPITFNYGVYNNYVVGIDIFFVLSGFIMVYISREKQGVQAAKDFIIRRIMRIIPVYWFYTFVLALIAIFLPQVLGKAEFIPVDFIKSLFFIPYLNTAGDLQPFLNNGWTLNYEMYFYAIFALCLLLPAKYSLFVMAAYFIGSEYTRFWGIEGVFGTFYSHDIILEFVAGAFIGYLFLKNIRLPSWMFWVGVLFLILSFVALFFHNTLEGLGIEYNRPLVGGLSVLLLVLPKKAEFIKMPKFLVMIGDSSYTLYLAHPFAIGAITQIVLLMNWQAVIHPWIIFTTIIAVSLVGSYIAYQIIEKPLLSLGKRVVYKNR